MVDTSTVEEAPTSAMEAEVAPARRKVSSHLEQILSQMNILKAERAEQEAVKMALRSSLADALEVPEGDVVGLNVEELLPSTTTFPPSTPAPQWDPTRRLLGHSFPMIFPNLATGTLGVAQGFGGGEGEERGGEDEETRTRRIKSENHSQRLGNKTCDFWNSPR